MRQQSKRNICSLLLKRFDRVDVDEKLNADLSDWMRGLNGVDKDKAKADLEYELVCNRYMQALHQVGQTVCTAHMESQALRQRNKR